MPNPPQSHFAIPKNPTIDQLARTLELVIAHLPFMEVTRWQKPAWGGSIALDWEIVATEPFQLGEFYWDKTHQWTSVDFTCDIPVSFFGDSGNLSVYVDISRPSAPSTSVRYIRVASRSIHESATPPYQALPVTISGTINDLADYPNTRLPIGRWLVRFGLVSTYVDPDPSTALIYSEDSAHFTICESHQRRAVLTP